MTATSSGDNAYSAPIGSKAAGAAFKDAWPLEDVDIAWIGLIAEKEPSLPSVIEAAGTAHGKSMEAYLVMMAVRLLEMRRLLKPTGSIYLHCDPTACHYLKMLMDAVIGWKRFRNEIVWCYKGGDKSKSDFGRKHDIILRYALGRGFRFNADSVRVPYEGEGTGRTDVSRWGSRRVGNTDVPYEPNLLGKVPEDWWDIPQLNSNAPERVGYPTQEPLKLLDRIILASSNEGDVVLDPFCGCATTCVSAHALGRLWTGIDISPKAAELIVQRLQQDYKGQQVTWMTQATKVIHRTDIHNARTLASSRRTRPTSTPCTESRRGAARDVGTTSRSRISPWITSCRSRRVERIIWRIFSCYATTATR